MTEILQSKEGQLCNKHNWKQIPSQVILEGLNLAHKMTFASLFVSPNQQNSFKLESH